MLLLITFLLLIFLCLYKGYFIKNLFKSLMISLNENKINQTEIRKKRIKNFKFSKNHKKKI